VSIAPFKKGLILSSNLELVKALKVGLKSEGVSNVTSVTAFDQVENSLVDPDPAILVIDWKCDEAKVVSLLEATKARQLDVAVVLYSEQITGRLISIGIEFNVASLASMANNPKELKTSFKKAIAVYYEQAPLRAILKKLDQFKKDGDSNSMIQLLKVTLEKNPSSNTVELELAATLIDSGDWSGAEPYLRKLCLAQPPNLRAQHLYSRILMKKGQFAVAEKLLLNCKILNPHNAQRLSDLGRSVFEQAGRSAEALVFFEQAIAVDPTHKEAQLGKGECLLAQGEVEQAMDLIKGSTSVKEVASIFNLAAIMNIREKKYEHGINLYQIAVNSLSNDNATAARLYFNAGLGFKRWDKVEDAKRCLEKSIELDPTFTRSQSVIDRINGKPAPAPVPAFANAKGDALIGDGAHQYKPAGNLESVEEFETVAGGKPAGPSLASSDDGDDIPSNFSGFDDVDFSQEES
jgi:tetratricopeptide (TPR) repeat protein